MNWALSLICFLGLISLSHAVILSLEEAELGEPSYRYFYLTVPDIDSGFYQKPYFTLVNDQLSRPYGALGSLTCGSSTDGIAVYMDVDNDMLKEWTCQSINLLPFAHEGGGPPSPPICAITAPNGLPALWNMTAGSWECGPYNQILTLATREDISISCQTADFMMFYASVDEIRCVNPRDIDPANTMQGSGRRDVSVDLEERVDTANDKKWYNIMSDMDMTTQTNKAWNYWRWTPFINYDSTSGSSLVSTPPVALPFASSLLAVTVASFKVSSYTYIILPPTGTDHFTATFSKLSTTLVETSIVNNVDFTSVSATSGQLTFPLSTNANSHALPGEAFVGGVINRSWGTFSISSDRHLIALTLWITTSQSFTSFWPLA